MAVCELKAETSSTVTSGPSTVLTGDHQRMLDEVAARVDDLVRVTEADKWPALELQALIGCLEREVVEQAAKEERECYARLSPSKLTHLSRDHARLRAATQILARAAAGEGSRSTAQIVATARSLFSQLQRHVGAEQKLFASMSARSREAR